MLNSIVQVSTVTLKWTESDVDFETHNPPTTRIAETQSKTSLNQNL